MTFHSIYASLDVKINGDIYTISINWEKTHLKLHLQIVYCFPDFVSLVCFAPESVGYNLLLAVIAVLAVDDEILLIIVDLKEKCIILF